MSSSTPTPNPSSTSKDDSSTGLPGMKRGIAIGVGVCVTIVIIALVSYLAFKRRRRLKNPNPNNPSDLEKSGAGGASTEPGTPLPPQIRIETTLSQDSSDMKHYSGIGGPYLEPDSSPVHEMGTDVRARELMTKANVAELKGDEMLVYELDGSEVQKVEKTVEQDAKDKYLSVGDGNR